jgi:hypothetical protein
MKFPDIKPEIIKLIRNKVYEYTSRTELDTISPIQDGYYVVSNGYQFYFDQNINIVDYSFQCRTCL